MQLVREINGEVVQHSHFFNDKGIPIPAGNPTVELVLSDKKFGYGKYLFNLSGWENVKQQSVDIPVRLGSCHHAGTEIIYYLFMYKKRYYLTEIDMDGNEVLLALNNLWQGKKEKLTRELERIKAKAEYEGNVRMPIPEDVQVLVWNRDGGKCVKCGGIENLEFDHIIPLSKGGSNTARNIQLLCEHCNRSKSSKIGG